MTLSDSTGTAKLTLWQDNIGILEFQKSYLLKNLHVRSFMNMKYLTPSKSFKYELCEDLLNTIDMTDCNDDPYELKKVQITTVTGFTKKVCCPRCIENVIPLP